jgi:hypothetical protein
MSDNLSNVKVGDVVLIKNFGLSNERLAKVEKVTKTQIHACNIRFRISDGCEIGTGWGKAILRIPTEEDIIRVANANKRRKLLSYIKENIEKCSLSDMEEIYKIMSNSKA